MPTETNRKSTKEIMTKKNGSLSGMRVIITGGPNRGACAKVTRGKGNYWSLEGFAKGSEPRHVMILYEENGDNAKKVQQLRYVFAEYELKKAKSSTPMPPVVQNIGGTFYKIHLDAEGNIVRGDVVDVEAVIGDDGLSPEAKKQKINHPNDVHDEHQGSKNESTSRTVSPDVPDEVIIPAGRDVDGNAAAASESNGEDDDAIQFPINLSKPTNLPEAESNSWLHLLNVAKKHPEVLSVLQELTAGYISKNADKADDAAADALLTLASPGSNDNSNDNSNASNFHLGPDLASEIEQFAGKISKEHKDFLASIKAKHFDSHLSKEKQEYIAKRDSIMKQLDEINDHISYIELKRRGDSVELSGFFKQQVGGAKALKETLEKDLKKFNDGIRLCENEQHEYVQWGKRRAEDIIMKKLRNASASVASSFLADV